LREPENYPPAKEYEDVRRGNVALWHDVTLGLPIQMYACDVLYSELPWKDGYAEFNRRADAAINRRPLNRLTYEEWCYRLSVTLARWDRPFVLVAGRAALRHMAAEWVAPCDLNGSTAVAFGAGLPAIHRRTADDVLASLADRYQCVADPCCGYGRSARAFAERGKSFVVSDHNPRCIGYIKTHAGEWSR
jgi:hypothetical protein